jgi:hypothetical protein
MMNIRFFAAVVTLVVSHFTTLPTLALAETLFDNNYESCLLFGPGNFCNVQQLTTQQREEVILAASKRNYEHCLLLGTGTFCSQEQLSEVQRREVSDAALRRNYEHCLLLGAGTFCNKVQLS